MNVPAVAIAQNAVIECIATSKIDIFLFNNQCF